MIYDILPIARFHKNKRHILPTFPVIHLVLFIFSYKISSFSQRWLQSTLDWWKRSSPKASKHDWNIVAATKKSTLSRMLLLCFSSSEFFSSGFCFSSGCFSSG
jgi:hypothetical protein